MVAVWFVMNPRSPGTPADMFGVYGEGVQVLAAATADRCVVLWDAISGKKVNVGVVQWERWSVGDVMRGVEREEEKGEGGERRGAEGSGTSPHPPSFDSRLSHTPAHSQFCTLPNVLEVVPTTIETPDSGAIEARGSLSNQGITLHKVCVCMCVVGGMEPGCVSLSFPHLLLFTPSSRLLHSNSNPPSKGVSERQD